MVAKKKETYSHIPNHRFGGNFIPGCPQCL